MDASVAVPIVVWFDDDCGVCTAAVRLLSGRTDASVRFRPSWELTDPRLTARADVALLVVGPRGLEQGRAAVAAVLDRCGRWGPVASFLLALPVVDQVGDAVYGLVAANRSRLSRWLGLPAACDLRAQGSGRGSGMDTDGGSPTPS